MDNVPRDSMWFDDWGKRAYLNKLLFMHRSKIAVSKEQGRIKRKRAAAKQARKKQRGKK